MEPGLPQVVFLGDDSTEAEAAWAWLRGHCEEALRVTTLARALESVAARPEAVVWVHAGATRSMEMRPIEVGISRFAGIYYANWPYQMASAVVAILPVLLLFIFFQRYFVRGIQLTGIKG